MEFFNIMTAVNDMSSDIIEVLVVDSDDERREAHVEKLSTYDRLSVHGSATVAGAKIMIEDSDIDCVLSQRRLEDGIAFDVFRAATEEKAEVGAIIIATSEERPLFLEGTDLIDGYVDMEARDDIDPVVDLICDGYDDNAFASYPVPDDEQERLDILADYRGHVNQQLDRLVEQAADDFDVDKASIRFIGREKQEYVATYGFIAKEIDREQAVCKHTILENDVLVIENLQEDQRFEDNDMFEAMDIDWYAGAVISLHGKNIGTFCLEDSEKQEFTDDDVERLKEYASQAANLLVLERELREGETSLADAVRTVWAES